MNELKNVINQEGKYVECVYNDKKYNCTLLGELADGDTIQVLLPLSNQNDNSDSDILISIDDGITYYNLLDKNGDFTLKASDFEYKNIYLKAVISGKNAVLISPERVKNVITCQLSELMKAPTTTTTFPIPVNELVYKKGNRLAIGTTNAGTTCIKIGAGVKSVLVNGNIQFNNTNNSSSTYYVGYIYRMRTGETSVLVSRSISNIVEAGDNVSVSMSSKPIEVQEGDFLIFNGYKTSTTGNAAIGEGQRTYMTVQVIE